MRERERARGRNERKVVSRCTDLLDAPALDSLGSLSGNAWQEFAVLLQAERQVTSGHCRHGREEDRLMEGCLQTRICCC